MDVQLIGNDLVIAIKEDGVAFADLADKVTIKNDNSYANKIEHIVLNDGTEVNLNDFLLIATQGDDTLHAYVNKAVTIDGLGGNDEIITGNSNDNIIGGTVF